MNVLVDTPIWSAALRRRHPAGAASAALASLLNAGRAVIIGPVRQEVLSGIRPPAEFERVRDGLRRIVDLPVETEDYERAAEFFNTCRAKGVQGSMTDFLLCAVGARHALSIYTDDRDFTHFARYVPVERFEA